LDPEDIDPAGLMLRTGYLTVRGAQDTWPDGARLRYPNLDVKASLIPLLSGIRTEDPLKSVTHLLKGRSDSAYASFTARDSRRFARSFESLLSLVPYRPRLSRESFYEALFLTAMAVSGQDAALDGQAGGGEYGASLQAPSGDMFVIGFRHLETGGVKASDEEGIRRKTAGLLKQAMKGIRAKKYRRKVTGGSDRIWKAAVAVNDRMDVTAVFEQSRNWRVGKDSQDTDVIEMIE
jgi:hypothetical protein